MLDWLHSSGLFEVSHEQLQVTWKLNLEQKSTVLDIAFLYTLDAQIACLQIHWAESSMLFDHAAILINLPRKGWHGLCQGLSADNTQGQTTSQNQLTQEAATSMSRRVGYFRSVSRLMTKIFPY
jgi:hypothetical protein